MINFCQLGLQDYSLVWQQMVEFTQQRDPHTVDAIWLLEHYPVFTLGTSASSEDIIGSLQGIPMVKTDRGGQITYHGPGQLIGYMLFDLRRKNLRIKALVEGTECALIDTLAEYGVHAHTIVGAPGVYVNNCKIASLGFKMHRGCCYHGFSFNIAMDLTPFSYINPCGMKNLQMANLTDLAAGSTLDEVIPLCKKHLLRYFG